MGLAFVVALQHPAATQKAPQRVPPRAVEGGPDGGVWSMRHHALAGGEPVESPSAAGVEVGQALALSLCGTGIQAPGGQPGSRQGVSET